MAVTTPLIINIHRRRYAFGRAFTLGKLTRTHVDAIEVTLTRGGRTGRGECVPNPRYGESPDSVVNQITQLPLDFDRKSLPALLRPGPARNAVDCALWDLEAKQKGVRVWQLAGLNQPRPLETVVTLSIDDPVKLAEDARKFRNHRVMKFRAASADDIRLIPIVRQAAPHVKIILDAGESWTVDDYVRLAPRLAREGVVLIEQPLPSIQDRALAEIKHPIPICADESCHDLGTLPRLQGRYDMINIKLDKTGGLTHALALRDAAHELGIKTMIGSMISSSLAMAPAVLAAQDSTYVDLDGPLLLAEDRPHGLHYDGSWVHPPKAELWG
ncbi:N-acetyl-D-Glu racemase DgcA [Paracoccus zhejiangensis]|uniref:Dipeptide epimerase n=1 Tax=Paracoccus zhejiangensis TaxID=1077935 RepID=A0A2H5F1G9_9RHOB|nr:N-acetyl-D-Glu racemase DgcA [Paracoccus zhejiangensis]AUH65409.1 dipeptide epimerase [Paracoccus zhejiangensis]